MYETRVFTFFFLSKHSLSFPLLSQSFRDYGVSTLEQHFYSCDARVSCSARRSTAAFVAKKKRAAPVHKRKEKRKQSSCSMSLLLLERGVPAPLRTKGEKKKRANTNDENKKKRSNTKYANNTKKKCFP